MLFRVVLHYTQCLQNSVICSNFEFLMDFNFIKLIQCQISSKSANLETVDYFRFLNYALECINGL